MKLNSIKLIRLNFNFVYCLLFIVLVFPSFSHAVFGLSKEEKFLNAAGKLSGAEVKYQHDLNKLNSVHKKKATLEATHQSFVKLQEEKLHDYTYTIKGLQERINKKTAKVEKYKPILKDSKTHLDNMKDAYNRAQGAYLNSSKK